MFGEAAFYLGCYLPLKAYLQRPVIHPPPPTKAERAVLFQRVRENITEPDLYLSKWFMNADVADIKRENLKEFFAWSLINERYEHIGEAEDHELEEYLDLLEHDFGRRFEPGRGKAVSLRGTLDHVPMQHRPLLWYGVGVHR